MNTPVEILLKDYRGHCQTIGRQVAATTHQGRVTGRGFDITPDGHLIVLDDSGTKHEIVDGSVEHLG